MKTSLRWSLDEIFSSFESSEYQKMLKECDQHLEKINYWIDQNLKNNDNALIKIEEYLKLENKLFDYLNRLKKYATLMSSVDAKNKKAIQMLEKIAMKQVKFKSAVIQFINWLGEIENLEELINSSRLLEEHSLFLHEQAMKKKYLLSEAEEVLVAKMSISGAESWAKLKMLLTSTLLVDIKLEEEEKRLPLSVIRNLAYSPEPIIRKKAYEAELKAYQQIEEPVAACLNGIKGEVITISKQRGFESPLDEILLKSRMEKSTLDTMFRAIEESLPIFRKYFHRKAELLGHKNGLPFFDLFAPMGKNDHKFSFEEARAYIVDNFGSFSQKLADFVEHAFKNNWIDAEPREGKRGGAFCSNLHCIKESRILTNFNGSFNNVTTLAHELGHAYHGHSLNSQSTINSRYPLPLAETASIFTETIIIKAALNNASSEEAFGILETNISAAGQIIVDIYSRFLFESELFKRRAESSLSVAELKEIMLDAQKKAYGNGLDHHYLHPYMWINKNHYYKPERNFYNFPYAFGLLFAKGLYSIYLEQGDEFVDKYDLLLSVSGKQKIADVAKMVGIDLNSIDFWRSSLALIEKDIEVFLQLSETKLKKRNSNR